MSTELISKVASRLANAAASAEAITQWAVQDIQLSVAEAYQVQQQVVASRLASGHKVLGLKMGFTSRAKMLQMGVSDLICGVLTSDMWIEDGGTLDLGRFIHARVEPEIAFLLKAPLTADSSLAQVYAAVEAVAPALEVIDSRYRDFQFSLPDVIADNCSSAAFCIGQWQKPTLDLTNLGMVMSFHGKAQQIGSSAAILGNPYRSLLAAARLAGLTGQALEAGSIVLAGAATAAEALPAGSSVRLETEALGRVDFSVAGNTTLAGAA
jgi:2-oxo-3-hexenedioate decarboxylase